ncbi:transposase [Nostoc sp. NMS4]|uniref:IS4/Tn5 family transposase DNA-binding protein n=1 Tax=Nostoc sp. NMS4 TaxID=2815390 RepID=UPI0025DAE0AE|nr:transposase [Nostoc sp. NMS4]MBN3924325.1 transposase [Nostoc sp. NMS4]
MEKWATEELKQADLGDARRRKRLIRIVEDLSAQPASSVPQACGNTAATYAAWSFAAKTCEITSDSGT